MIVTGSASSSGKSSSAPSSDPSPISGVIMISSSGKSVSPEFVALCHPGIYLTATAGRPPKGEGLDVILKQLLQPRPLSPVIESLPCNPSGRHCLDEGAGSLSTYGVIDRRPSSSDEWALRSRNSKFYKTSWFKLCRVRRKQGGDPLKTVLHGGMTGLGTRTGPVLCHVRHGCP